MNLSHSFEIKYSRKLLSPAGGAKRARNGLHPCGIALCVLDHVHNAKDAQKSK